MKEFELKNVVTFSFIYFPLSGIIIGSLILIPYGEYGFRYFGTMGLIFMGFFIMCSMFFLLFVFSTVVKIRFDEANIYIRIGNKEKKYLKSEIKGFYSHDYKYTSNISIQIQFTNGKKLEITDAKDIGNKYNPEKATMLQNFVSTAQKELGFQPIKTNKLRKFKQMGAIWFSKKQKNSAYERV